MLSTIDNPYFICERLRQLYLCFEAEGKSNSDEWKVVSGLYDRIGSVRQLDSDVADAEALLSQSD